MKVRLAGGVQVGIPGTSVKEPEALPAAEIQPGKLAQKWEPTGNKISINEDHLIKTIEKMNKKLSGIPTSLEFTIHEKTHDIMIKVINQETGEVIREIPPEKILDMVAKFMEMAGLIVDERR